MQNDYFKDINFAGLSLIIELEIAILWTKQHQSNEYNRLRSCIEDILAHCEKNIPIEIEMVDGECFVRALCLMSQFGDGLLPTEIPIEFDDYRLSEEESQIAFQFFIELGGIFSVRLREVCNEIKATRKFSLYDISYSKDFALLLDWWVSSYRTNLMWARKEESFNLGRESEVLDPDNYDGVQKEIATLLNSQVESREEFIKMLDDKDCGFDEETIRFYKELHSKPKVDIFKDINCCIIPFEIPELVKDSGGAPRFEIIDSNQCCVVISDERQADCLFLKIPITGNDFDPTEIMGDLREYFVAMSHQKWIEDKFNDTQIVDSNWTFNEIVLDEKIDQSSPVGDNVFRIESYILGICVAQYRSKSNKNITKSIEYICNMWQEINDLHRNKIRVDVDIVNRGYQKVRSGVKSTDFPWMHL